jgi:hypothetical protein
VSRWDCTEKTLEPARPDVEDDKGKKVNGRKIPGNISEQAMRRV